MGEVDRKKESHVCFGSEVSFASWFLLPTKLPLRKTRSARKVVIIVCREEGISNTSFTNSATKSRFSLIIYKGA